MGDSTLLKSAYPLSILFRKLIPPVFVRSKVWADELFGYAGATARRAALCTRRLNDKEIQVNVLYIQVRFESVPLGRFPLRHTSFDII